jgi:SAM-dependent methyltransferase
MISMKGSGDPATTGVVLQSLGRIHGRLVHRSRVAALAGKIATLVQGHSTLVDVGCGDGRLTRAIADEIPGLQVEGFDVFARPGSSPIPLRAFDGMRLPLGDASVDAVMAVDVLHHAKDPMKLLAELRRVARRTVIIKDHRLSRPGARAILSIMDWIGNAPHGVALRYRYWTESQWRSAWTALHLTVVSYQTELGLYSSLARPFFEKGLHFLAKLEPGGGDRGLS